MSDIVGTNLQPLIFLACLGAGALSALVYGGCYIFRFFANHKKWAEILADLLFMLTSASTYLIALFYSGFAEIRLYTLLGFLCGFFPIYFLLRPLRKFLPKLREKLSKLKEKTIFRKIFR